MDDQLTTVVGVVIILAIVVGLIRGAVKTFQRNWIAALLLLIFLFPVWIVWAFIEVFTGEIKKDAPVPRAGHQNVNVTMINNSDDPSKTFTSKEANQPFTIIDAPEVENGQFKNALVNLQGEEGNKKICAYCAETIKFNAIVCRYCSRDV